MILGLLAMFQMISLTLLEVMRLDHLEATGGGSVSTYYGGTTYGNSYTENTSNYVQDQATTALHN